MGKNGTETIYISHYASPLGGLTLASDGTVLVGLWFDGQAHFGEDGGATHRVTGQDATAGADAELPVFSETRRWLDAYFAGRRPDAEPALRLRGTPFRRRVWALLRRIPYGTTVTYGALAQKLAEEMGVSRMSARAVGNAVGRNPISLLVPCHRVVGAGGRLTGYAAGVDKKLFLLHMEGAL